MPVFIGAVFWWIAVAYFKPPYASVLNNAVALLAGIYLTEKIIVWLRTWGAFIERRLIEIESRLTNERPEFYAGERPNAYDANPLFERTGREPKHSLQEKP